MDSLQISTIELEKNEDFLRRLINSIPTGIFLIDPETHIVEDINEYALNLIERTRMEGVGFSCGKTVCSGTIDSCLLSLTDDEKIGIKRTITSKSGKKIPIMKSAAQIERYGKNYILETFTDISEIEKVQIDLIKARDELEEKVADRTARLSAILETAMNGIIVVDDSAKITYFSPMAKSIFGYEEEEVLNKSMGILLSDSVRKDLGRALEDYKNGGEPRILGKRLKVAAIK